MFLKISQILQENAWVQTLLKTLQHSCFAVKFGKILRTPFLQNTSSGCFCQKRLQHSLPVKFAKSLRTLFLAGHLRWLLLNWHFSLVRFRNNKNHHDFLLISGMFWRYLRLPYFFTEIVQERKHYLFGFGAIQFFFSKQCFCLLITTIRNIYISNETS